MRGPATRSCRRICPALLTEGLYHADGQNDGEVYEYGSFLQSKMAASGVTCSDCHDPHSLELRAPGDAVCMQCHDARHASSEHHHHAAGSAGASCIACHMPAKTYMVVDPRRDHSFRVPRPDLSAELGTPNACAGCHGDRPATWAADRVKEWKPSPAPGHQGYARAFHDARTSARNWESALVTLLRDARQPAIARATAARELAAAPSDATFPALVASLADDSSIVREASLGVVEALPAGERWDVAGALVRDPVRAVRMRAASVLAPVPTEQLPANDRADLSRATEDFLAAQRLNADQPEAHVNLGNLEAARGDAASAEKSYRAAVALDPDWVPGWVNLADLLRARGRDAEAGPLLREALGRLPKAAALHHSLGLWLVRRSESSAALDSLRRAAELAPEERRYAYVYAVALDGAGRRKDALAVVDAALARAPEDRALAALRGQLGRD